MSKLVKLNAAKPLNSPNSTPRLTCYPCAVAKLEGVPHHRPVGDGQESLGVLIGVCCKGRKRAARATQDQGLETRGRDADCVGHRSDSFSAPQSMNQLSWLRFWRGCRLLDANPMGGCRWGNLAGANQSAWLVRLLSLSLGPFVNSKFRPRSSSFGSADCGFGGLRH